MRCEWRVENRRSVGVLGRGRESFRSFGIRQCKRQATEGAFCAQHAALARRYAR